MTGPYATQDSYPPCLCVSLVGVICILRGTEHELSIFKVMTKLLMDMMVDRGRFLLLWQAAQLIRQWLMT